MGGGLGGVGEEWDGDGKHQCMITSKKLGYGVLAK